MKARVKATGEIISLDEKSTVLDATPCNFNSYEISELEILYENTNFSKDYWEKLLHQFTGMAMQGMLNNSYLAGEFRKDPNNGIKDMSKIITKAAVVYAHALVEKLKEGKV